MLTVMTSSAVVLVLGAVGLLVAAGLQWRARAKKPPPEAAPGPHHLHYCTGCDRQWEHAGDGAACTRHWAVTCPACTHG